MADPRENGAAQGGEPEAQRRSVWKVLSRCAPLVPVLAAIVLAIVFRKQLTVETIVNAAPKSRFLTVLVLLGLYAAAAVAVALPVMAAWIKWGPRD